MSGFFETAAEWHAGRRRTDRGQYASPWIFFPLAARLQPWFAEMAIALFAAGIYLGSSAAPTGGWQGDACRLVFSRVPAAWMSMLLYGVMAFSGAAGLALNTRLSGVLASAVEQRLKPF